MRKTALVTGASSGIGLEMAGLLSLRGYNLLLVSNDPAGLDAACKRLATNCTDIQQICIDLSQPDAAVQAYNFARSKNMVVEVLVNNAGTYFFGEVVETDPQKALNLLQLHVITLSQLCILFGKEMKLRRKGYILNVSSVSAYRAFPGIAFYGSGKAFIRSFTRSLRTELRPYNIYVTCLSPGSVETNLYSSDNFNTGLLKRLGIMITARKAAKAGIDGLFSNKATVIPGGMTRIMLLLARIIPQWVIYMVRKKGKWLK